MSFSFKTYGALIFRIEG